MSEYILLKVNKTDIGISVESSGKSYTYLKKIGDNIETIGVHKQSPTQLSRSTDIGKKIYNYIKKLDYSLIEPIKEIDDRITRDKDINTVFQEEYDYLMEQLITALKNQVKQKNIQKQEEAKKTDSRYKKLYDEYCSRRDSYNFTDLQFIGQLSLGLGVGLHSIILKMFVNHMLTITNIKPSNQIVYSKQASGKSFIIEQTLKMIPDEFVLNGRTTPAFFFNEFDGKDVSGCIFNFGDLGGDNDNENTIEVRDLVKILNTDGIVERGVMIDGHPAKQRVTGKPSLTYSTVDNSIINDQEKSRGSVFSPPLIDEHQLTAFNSVHNSSGQFKGVLAQIDKDVESVKGLVWKLKDDLKDYEIFNPYAFNITELLTRMDDFNRKINEFDKTLLVVTYLNKPLTLKTEDGTNLMIASKQDVINALALFEGADNLLPNHRLCIENINRVFEFDKSAGDYYNAKEDDPQKSIDEYNRFMSTEMHEDLCATEKFDNNYKWEVNEGESKILFTISILRKKFRNQKWFSRVKDNLSEVLRTLYEYGYLLKFEKGKVEGENVYCLPLDINEKLSNSTPNFKGEDLTKGLSLCQDCYPELYDEVKAFVDKDSNKNVNRSNLELDKCNIYNLVWEKYNTYSKPINHEV